MGRARIPLGPLLPGGISLAIILGSVTLAIASLLREGGDGELELLTPYTLRVAGFTVLQAALSTFLSVSIGILVARALARRPRFPGRSLLLRLFGLPLVMPVIVAIFGIASVFGSGGAIARLSLWLVSVEWNFPYGLTGILVAHVFFNLPLSVRLLLPAIEAIPGETWRLASQIGMTGPQIFRRIEWPLLRRVLPGVAGLVFLLCFTSFAVILVFGGGPRATTLEVAIYQALRLDFDIERTVGLALLQIGICAVLVLAGQKFHLPARIARTEGRRQARPDARSLTATAVDAALILAAALYVGAPLVAVIARAAAGPVAKVFAAPAFWDALWRTVILGASAGLAALLLGWALVLTARDLRQRHRRDRLGNLLENVAALNLVVSPIVFGAGLFVLLLPFGLVFEHALLLACAVNAVATTPYVIRTLGPAADRVAEHFDQTCFALRIHGWNRFRIIEWPMLRSDAGRALALATGISMGDLTAIALFGTETSSTLSLYLYRLMGSYRMEEAAVVAATLALLCLGSFAAIERVTAGRARS